MLLCFYTAAITHVMDRVTFLDRGELGFFKHLTLSGQFSINSEEDQSMWAKAKDFYADIKRILKELSHTACTYHN